MSITKPAGQLNQRDLGRTVRFGEGRGVPYTITSVRQLSNGTTRVGLHGRGQHTVLDDHVVTVTGADQKMEGPQ